MVAMKRFKEVSPMHACAVRMHELMLLSACQAHLDEEVMRLVLREIRLLKASTHPNVVHLYEAFKSKSGRVYMVMEHVDHTLTETLKKSPFGFSAKNTKLITWQLLQATAFLHSNRVRARVVRSCLLQTALQGMIFIRPHAHFYSPLDQGISK